NARRARWNMANGRTGLIVLSIVAVVSGSTLADAEDLCSGLKRLAKEAQQKFKRIEGQFKYKIAGDPTYEATFALANGRCIVDHQGDGDVSYECSWDYSSEGANNYREEAKKLATAVQSCLGVSAEFKEYKGEPYWTIPWVQEEKGVDYTVTTFTRQ